MFLRRGRLFFHSYLVLFLAVAGATDEAYALAERRIEVDDAFMRQLLFRPGFRSVRQQPRAEKLFRQTGQWAYWEETGKWPDFCSDPFQEAWYQAPRRVT